MVETPVQMPSQQAQESTQTPQFVPGTGGATQAGATDALWYSYTPATDGLLSINSCASDPAGIDTRLYVYTDGCETLTLVANDDDGCDAPTTFGSYLLMLLL